MESQWDSELRERRVEEGIEGGDVACIGRGLNAEMPGAVKRPWKWGFSILICSWHRVEDSWRVGHGVFGTCWPAFLRTT